MNCFIASALGRDDVDEIYDRGIKPVLSEFKVRPLRVDRIEHNDDIDDKIFNLMDKSEICIADLTYARPSAYYEAGYMFGSGKPVIYIARNDHFKAKDNDPEGNLRVHFDLQMKNIIPWTRPNDIFKNKLRKRLKFVISPIIRKQKIDKKRLLEERQFNNLSQDGKMIKILKKAIFLFRAKGYSKSDYSEAKKSGRQPYFIHLEKRSNDIIHIVHLMVWPSINISNIKDNPIFLWPPTLNTEEKEHITSIKSNSYIITLQNCKSSTLLKIFPSWTPLSDHFLEKDRAPVFKEDLPMKSTVAVIDGVKSLPEFVERFKRSLSEIG